VSKKLTIAAAATLTALTSVSTAFAGGLEANGYNWDLLFDAAPYATKGTVSYVKIDQPIKNSSGAVVANSLDRVYYNAGFKADFNDASCLVSVQNPWGSGSERTQAHALSSRQAESEKIWSNDIGVTCGYGFNTGPGVFTVIGGISAQTLNYDAKSYASVTIPGAGSILATNNVELSGTAIGWRLGAAYEIEEIALRVSAIYNSSVDYRLTGKLVTSLPVPVPVPDSDATASVATPQSIEIKGQTGIAPGWLAMAGVKWVNWSELDKLTVVHASGSAASVLGYEDGWTVTLGIGHQLTEELTVLGSLAWDKGTSNGNGYSTVGHQTDRWSLSLGGAYKPSQNVELSAGLSYSIIEGGANALGETWEPGSVLALQGGLKVSF
jgi:long-chain fatty acid transport protein